MNTKPTTGKYSPMHLSSFTCLEDCPPSHDIPTKWTSVTLGTLAEIITNPDLPKDPDKP